MHISLSCYERSNIQTAKHKPKQVPRKATVLLRTHPLKNPEDTEWFGIQDFDPNDKRYLHKYLKVQLEQRDEII